MDIVIDDPLNIISKTQRKKIRKTVVDVWKDEDSFNEEIYNILEKIFYTDENQKYNVCKYDYTNHNNRLVLHFEIVQLETQESKRKELLNKLHNKLKSKQHINDPQWQMYEKIKNRLPEANKHLIPSPDKVKNDLDTYKTMMTMIPNQNPLYQYLSMFIQPT